MAGGWSLPLLRLLGHNDEVRGVAFSPGGQRVATAGREGTAKLWDAATGANLLTFKGHSEIVECVAFSPDGKLLVTGSADRTAKVWDIATATEWCNLRGHTEEAAQQEPLALETRQRARAGDRVQVGGNERIWKAVQLSTHRIDFNELVGHLSEWSVAYAVCYIQSRSEQTNLVMKIGSDDLAKVWLNGVVRYRSEVYHTFVPDQDRVDGIQLRAGLNVLVLKVVNEFRDWCGSIRLTDATGQPVEGVEVTLSPP
jgi:hypothetical protein